MSLKRYTFQILITTWLCSELLAQQGTGPVVYLKMLTILYEDDQIIVIDKPAGLAAQPGERVGRSVPALLEAQLGHAVFPIHRLDKETAGCMLLARNAGAASRWSSLLGDRRVKKTYLAVCAGSPARDSGRYEDALSAGGQTQTALTFYRLRARFGDGYSLLELELGTGRTHQIRRHMAMHGHPILGDDKYGDFSLNRQLRKSAGLKTLLLWAWRLELPGIPPIQSFLPDHFAAFFALWPDAPQIQPQEVP